jgi:hypothetical protein
MKTTVVNKYKSQFDVYIGRPSVYGNPFVIGRDGDRKEVISKYKAYFDEMIEKAPVFKRDILKLRGKRIACFCSPLACHGDVIANYLNTL